MGKCVGWKQNPFEKMKIGKNVKGSGQLFSVDPEPAKNKYPDDHELIL